MTVWPNSLQSKHGAVDNEETKINTYEVETTCGYTWLSTYNNYCSTLPNVHRHINFVVTVTLGHMTITSYIMYMMYMH